LLIKVNNLCRKRILKIGNIIICFTKQTDQIATANANIDKIKTPSSEPNLAAGMAGVAGVAGVAGTAGAAGSAACRL
jgi:hypothetical protein